MTKILRFDTKSSNHWTIKAPEFDLSTNVYKVHKSKLLSLIKQHFSGRDARINFAMSKISSNLSSKESQTCKNAENFVESYEKVINGDEDALTNVWEMLYQSDAKLLFSLHMWDCFTKGKISDITWSKVLSLSWCDRKNNCLFMGAVIPTELLVAMFKSLPNEALMFYQDELERFKGLSDTIEVWRGTDADANFTWDGISWTTNRALATWYAYRSYAGGYTPILLKGIVKKNAVIARFNPHWELIIDPSFEIIHEDEIWLDSDDEYSEMEELKQKIYQARELDMEQCN
jgi:hypothetical protein